MKSRSIAGLCDALRGKTPIACRFLRKPKPFRLPSSPPCPGLPLRRRGSTRGAINVRIGEGRTADVLRNLCYQVRTEKPELWQKIVEHIHDLFGSKLASPNYVAERGEILMTYQGK